LNIPRGNLLLSGLGGLLGNVARDGSRSLGGSSDVGFDAVNDPQGKNSLST
jgi:hypothetical protein